MNTTLKRALFWTPRLLCVLFALDIFGQGHGLRETLMSRLHAG